MAANPAAAAEGPHKKPPPPPRPLSVVSTLPFWFYLTAAVSLLALLLPHLLSPNASPPLPPLLRRHLSDGRLLKLHPGPDLFAVTSRPPAHSAHHHPVLVLPGLAAGSFSFRRLLSTLSSRGLVAAAIDLPGQGLSPPPPAPPPRTNPLREIMDHGIFHAFEHLVETGEVPFQESAPDASHSFYDATEAAAAVARAVDALGLAPVHLVIHDSALAAGAAFVSANPAAVLSVTLIDTTATLPAFPSAVLGVPVLGRLVLWVPALFKGLMRLCCVRGMDAQEADAHRAAMRGEVPVQSRVLVPRVPSDGSAALPSSLPPAGTSGTWVLPQKVEPMSPPPVQLEPMPLLMGGRAAWCGGGGWELGGHGSAPGASAMLCQSCTYISFSSPSMSPKHAAFFCVG